MANIFDISETVICTIAIKDADGTAQDPVTSMNIEIIRITPNPATMVASTGMEDDTGDGAYHYDCDTTGYLAGFYMVKYTATDGDRVTIQTDTFILE